MKIFSESQSIVSDVVNRILNSKEVNALYLYGEKTYLTNLYPTIKVLEFDEKEAIKGSVVYAEVESIEMVSRLHTWITSYREEIDFILYVPSEEETVVKELSQFGMAYPLSKFSALSGFLFLIGETFDKKNWAIADDFKVLAIVHFYNEADILDKTIQHLLDEELDVYLLDNWSEDSSYEIALAYKNRYPNRIYLEKFPSTGKTDCFEWYNQLARTEEIAKEVEYDWFIHYDADEIRVAPWEGVNLRTALYWIDRLGYNCVENNVIDFRVTDVEQDNIFGQDVYFDFRHVFNWFNHLKTWKKSDYIDLKSTGGHTVKINNPKVFPLKILNKHYPIRSVEHGYRKVLKDRVPRFVKERRERGWHGHYDHIKGSEEIIYNQCDLLQWSDTTRLELFIPLFMELGLRWNNLQKTINVPSIQDKKLIVYGAGNIGRRGIVELAKNNEIVAWVDVNYDTMPWMCGIKIECLQEVIDKEFDYFVVAVVKENTKNEISSMLKETVVDEKIIWMEKTSV